MHEINLAQMDLNLLLILDTLLKERHVSRAAKKLGRTQPALSHALGRLREMFQDDILVRAGGDLKLTPKAEQLTVELPRLLQSLQQLFDVEATFRPETSKKTFRLGGPDFAAALLAPLATHMSQKTPNASVEFVLASQGMFRDLVEGRLDAAVAPTISAQNDGLVSEDLGDLNWVVYARKGHPAFRGWNAKRWVEFPHIQVRTPSSSESPVERAAREKNLKRQIGAIVPQFFMAASLLSKTDYLMTVPQSVLEPLAQKFELKAMTVPFKIEPISMALHYPSTKKGDPANQWFREHVKATYLATFGK